MGPMEILLLLLFVLAPALLFALIPAKIAQQKGRDFGPWYIYGVFLWIVALIHAVVLEPDQDTLDNNKLAHGNKECPFCAEIIKAKAIVCRYCGRDLPPKNIDLSSNPGTPENIDLKADLGTTTYDNENEIDGEQHEQFPFWGSLTKAIIISVISGLAVYILLALMFAAED